MESHGGIMVLWLANGQTGRGCRRLSVVLGGDREAHDLSHDMRAAGEAFEGVNRMGLGGQEPLGEVKTKAPNADYHKNESPVAARQAEVARDYLKRAARIDELNGHPPGSDGPMLTALKKHNGGRVLVCWSS